MNKLLTGAVWILAVVALTPSAAHPQAPSGERRVRWCDPQYHRCTNVVVPDPVELQNFCVLLAERKQKLLDARAIIERLRQEGLRTGNEIIEGVLADDLRDLTEIENVFRGYAVEARCPPFVPRAPAQ